MTRYLGVDYGTKRVGLAVGDEPDVLTADGEPIIAPYPLATVPRSRSLSHDLAEILRLGGLENVTAIVVGLPVNADGTHGASAQAATEFANALRKRTDLPVELFNEYGTSQEAESQMLDADVSRAKRRERVDRLAAANILHGFLRHKHNQTRKITAS